MNKNYRAGRRLEYESMTRWKDKGYTCVRSAGSHGVWDICAVRSGGQVSLIQCKLTEHEHVAKHLFKWFKEHPPMTPSPCYHMVLEVKVKGCNDIRSYTI